MTTAAIVKKAVKEAIDETLLAHQHELEAKITEKLEDAALVRAIEKGRKSKLVSRASVMRALRGTE